MRLGRSSGLSIGTLSCFHDSCFHRLVGTQCIQHWAHNHLDIVLSVKGWKPKSQKLSVLVGYARHGHRPVSGVRGMHCGADPAAVRKNDPVTGTTCDPSTTLSAVNSAGGQHRAGQTRRARSPRRRAWEPSPLCSADAFPKRPRRRAPSPWCMPPPSPRVGLCCVIGTRLMSFPPAQRIPLLTGAMARSQANDGPRRLDPDRRTWSFL